MAQMKSSINMESMWGKVVVSKRVFVVGWLIWMLLVCVVASSIASATSAATSEDNNGIDVRIAPLPEEICLPALDGYVELDIDLLCDIQDGEPIVLKARSSATWLNVVLDDDIFTINAREPKKLKIVADDNEYGQRTGFVEIWITGDRSTYSFPISVVIDIVQEGATRPDAPIFTEDDFATDLQNWGGMIGIMKTALDRNGSETRYEYAFSKGDGQPIEGEFGSIFWFEYTGIKSFPDNMWHVGTTSFGKSMTNLARTPADAVYIPPTYIWGDYGATHLLIRKPATETDPASHWAEIPLAKNPAKGVDKISRSTVTTGVIIQPGLPPFEPGTLTINFKGGSGRMNGGTMLRYYVGPQITWDDPEAWITENNLWTYAWIPSEQPDGNRPFNYYVTDPNATHSYIQVAPAEGVSYPGGTLKVMLTNVLLVPFTPHAPELTIENDTMPGYFRLNGLKPYTYQYIVDNNPVAPDADSPMWDDATDIWVSSKGSASIMATGDFVHIRVKPGTAINASEIQTLAVPKVEFKKIYTFTPENDGEVIFEGAVSGSAKILVLYEGVFEPGKTISATIATDSYWFDAVLANETIDSSSGVLEIDINADSNKSARIPRTDYITVDFAYDEDVYYMEPVTIAVTQKADPDYVTPPRPVSVVVNEGTAPQTIALSNLFNRFTYSYKLGDSMVVEPEGDWLDVVYDPEAGVSDDVLMVEGYDYIWLKATNMSGQYSVASLSVVGKVKPYSLEFGADFMLDRTGLAEGGKTSIVGLAPDTVYEVAFVPSLDSQPVYESYTSDASGKIADLRAPWDTKYVLVRLPEGVSPIPASAPAIISDIEGKIVGYDESKVADIKAGELINTFMFTGGLIPNFRYIYAFTDDSTPLEDIPYEYESLDVPDTFVSTELGASCELYIPQDARYIQLKAAPYSKDFETTGTVHVYDLQSFKTWLIDAATDGRDVIIPLDGTTQFKTFKILTAGSFVGWPGNFTARMEKDSWIHASIEGGNTISGTGDYTVRISADPLAEGSRTGVIRIYFTDVVSKTKLPNAINIVVRQTDEYISPSPLLAFPGAEGFGAYSTGGRGGDVYYVTNLNDSGPGSLRYGCETVPEEGRTIVFAVGGTIWLERDLVINKGKLTIAGQTAPGDGIQIAGHGIYIQADDVVIRFLTIRVGDEVYTESGGEKKVPGVDCISVGVGKNIIVDHVSAGWSADETMSISEGAGRSSYVDFGNITFQWCIISEAINMSDRFDDPNRTGKGTLINLGYGGGISIIHNLYHSIPDRVPRIGSYTTAVVDPLGPFVEFSNNVITNAPNNRPGYSSGNAGARTYAFQNNYYRWGANSPVSGDFFIHQEYGTHAKAFVSGNFIDFPQYTASGNNVPEDQWVLIKDGFRGTKLSSSPFSHVTYKMEEPAPYVFNLKSAEESFALVLNKVGNSLRRDAADLRIIDEIKENTGAIVKYVDGVLERPIYRNGPAPIDTDKDGMPDFWEIANGLDPNDPDDRNGTDLSIDGYTNLEVYLNSLVSHIAEYSTVVFSPDNPPIGNFVDVETPVLDVVQKGASGASTSVTFKNARSGIKYIYAFGPDKEVPPENIDGVGAWTNVPVSAEEMADLKVAPGGNFYLFVKEVNAEGQVSSGCLVVPLEGQVREPEPPEVPLRMGTNLNVRNLSPSGSYDTPDDLPYLVAASAIPAGKYDFGTAPEVGAPVTWTRMNVDYNGSGIIGFYPAWDGLHAAYRYAADGAIPASPVTYTGVTKDIQGVRYQDGDSLQNGFNSASRQGQAPPLGKYEIVPNGKGAFTFSDNTRFLPYMRYVVFVDTKDLDKDTEDAGSRYAYTSRDAVNTYVLTSMGQAFVKWIKENRLSTAYVFYTDATGKPFANADLTGEVSFTLEGDPNDWVYIAPVNEQPGIGFTVRNFSPYDDTFVEWGGTQNSTTSGNNVFQRYPLCDFLTANE